VHSHFNPKHVICRQVDPSDMILIWRFRHEPIKNRFNRWPCLTWRLTNSCRRNRVSLRKVYNRSQLPERHRISIFRPWRISKLASSIRKSEFTKTPLTFYQGRRVQEYIYLALYYSGQRPLHLGRCGQSSLESMDLYACPWS